MLSWNMLRVGLALLALLALAVGYLLASQWFGKKEGAADARLFTKHATEDRFRRTFHRQRFLWRGLALALGAAAATTPLLLVCQCLWVPLFAVALLVWGAALWNDEFTVTLNRERYLQYVDEYYVSPSETAAFWDRTITGLAAYLQVHPSYLHMQVLVWCVRTGAFMWCTNFFVFILHLLAR